MKKRKSRKRIHGNDRGLMMICRDIRRRWLQYGENRQNIFKRIIPEAKKISNCYGCKQTYWNKQLQIDHIKPLGPRPRQWVELGEYAKKMFERKCQALCKECHKEKTDVERKK